jgi:putative redox protein
MESNILWIKDMQFESQNRGLSSTMDSTPEYSGNNQGPSPKESVLNAMCVCSGMDVVSVAKKMRLEIATFTMEGRADPTKTIPSYFASVHIKYVIEGKGESEKYINCVVLSMTKYCGVSYMISKVCPITYEIILNGTKIHEDQAKFLLEAGV